MSERVSENTAEDIIIEHDTGARQPSGPTGILLTVVALSWSLFQLWVASPLQYELGVFILNSTQIRALHLAFAAFLAFTAYPMFRSSPRSRIPWTDWLFALAASFCAAYNYIFYEQLALRPGQPTNLDVGVAIVGLVLLLEAARRTLGMPLMIMGIIFLGYTLFGDVDWMPTMIAHKGQSLNKIASHQWLSTEGVFGVALGVSASFVFLFVLFGALLDKAGAGNYFIKVAFSLLGHLRGGPAKAAVLSSGLTGFISGSSIANVVTTGTFTVPLMRRVGFSAEKAGAVEVGSSVNGQIMPPVMGAAAFIMVEYVGIPYQQVIKHAFLPAVISYVALLYMVHLEALKNDFKALEKPVHRTAFQRLLGTGITVSSILILAGIVYYGVGWIKGVVGEQSPYVFAMMIGIVYVALIRYASRFPDLEEDDPDAPVYALPHTGPTVKTGLHFLLPLVVLIWSLMIERLSPGLSALWACVMMIIILVTQRPLLAFFRKQNDLREAFHGGVVALREGLIAGARNMVGIAVATAAAGIIVGAISQTGIGNAMVQVVEALSGGSLVLMLICTAVISLILGMGLPTTANYIVVSSIMAGVLMELGKQHGLIVPPIAVHMFVFYFGIMADVTPPVGLASFAAAAVSKGDPIKTGLLAFLYSTRTAILPFFFIFNNELLLIGVDDFWHGLGVFLIATIALMMFSAAIQGFFVVRNRMYESAIMMLVTFMLFIPGEFLSLVYPEYQMQEGSSFKQVIREAEPGERLKLRILGQDKLGDPKVYYIYIGVPEGDTVTQRLDALGLSVAAEGDNTVVENITFNSPLKNTGLQFYDEILRVMVPNQRPAKYIVFIPAFALIGLIYLLQRRRRARVVSTELQVSV